MHGKAVLYTGAPGQRVKAHDQVIILDSKQSTAKMFHKPTLLHHAMAAILYMYIHDMPKNVVHRFRSGGRDVGGRFRLPAHLGGRKLY